MKNPGSVLAKFVAAIHNLPIPLVILVHVSGVDDETETSFVFKKEVVVMAGIEVVVVMPVLTLSLGGMSSGLMDFTSVYTLSDEVTSTLEIVPIGIEFGWSTFIRSICEK